MIRTCAYHAASCNLRRAIALPSEGSVEVLVDNRIEYTPDGEYTGDDSFIYEVTDADVTTATVAIQVTCESCDATVILIKLSWDPNPVTENVTSYSVFYGNSADTELSFYEELTSADIDLSEPIFSMEAQKDLNAEGGDTVCFQLSATNSIG